MSERAPFPFTPDELGPDVIQAMNSFNAGGLEGWLQTSLGIEDDNGLEEWSNFSASTPVLEKGIDTQQRVWTQWKRPNLYQKEQKTSFSLFNGYTLSTVKHAIDEHRQLELCPQYSVSTAEPTGRRTSNFTVLEIGMGMPMVRAVYSPSGALRHITGYMMFDEFNSRLDESGESASTTGNAASSIGLLDEQGLLIQEFLFFEMFAKSDGYYTQVVRSKNLPQYYPREDAYIKNMAKKGDLSIIKPGDSIGIANRRIGLTKTEAGAVRLTGYIDEIEAYVDTHELVFPTQLQDSERLYHFLTTDRDLDLSAICQLVPLSGRFDQYDVEFNNLIGPRI